MTKWWQLKNNYVMPKYCELCCSPIVVYKIRQRLPTYDSITGEIIAYDTEVCIGCSKLLKSNFISRMINTIRYPRHYWSASWDISGVDDTYFDAVLVPGPIHLHDPETWPYKTYPQI